jgi:hypothetical protein
MKAKANWRPVMLVPVQEEALAEAESLVADAAYLGAAWGAFLLFNAAYQWSGAIGVAPYAWNLVAGAAVPLLAAAIYGRSPVACALAAAVALADLTVLLFCLPSLYDAGSVTDLAMASLRIVSAPFFLFVTVQGYRGCNEYRSLRSGRRSTWRNINPVMLTASGAAVWASVVLLGLFTWGSEVSAGFAQPGARILSKGEAASLSATPAGKGFNGVKPFQAAN